MIAIQDQFNIVFLPNRTTSVRNGWRQQQHIAAGMLMELRVGDIIFINSCRYGDLQFRFTIKNPLDSFASGFLKS